MAEPPQSRGPGQTRRRLIAVIGRGLKSWLADYSFVPERAGSANID